MLDVACGTGIVARLAAPLVGPDGAVVGVDLNPRMLDVAREQAAPEGAPVDWRHGEAASLPCPEGDFGVVLCQQGLQFFPDRLAALRDMRRVSKRQGRVGVCVWCAVDQSPCHCAIADALRRHVGETVARRFQPPFGFGDRDALFGAMVEAGFRDVEIQVDVIRRRLLPPEESIPGLLASTPMAPEIGGLAAGTQVPADSLLTRSPARCRLIATATAG